jgi:DNA-binding PadR family transcriptional regulator
MHNQKVLSVEFILLVLQALCEKGLVAMENSHRRIIAELEEKHREEIEQLRHEKEQALAEETQATLAGTGNNSNMQYVLFGKHSFLLEIF